MKQVVRTVVVGYGRAGKNFHCPLIRLAPGLKLYGIVSREPEKREIIQKQEQCRAFASLEEALADPNVDLIVIVTPNATHAPLAIQAMSAGKHVVTDKVMCLNLQEFDQMVEVAQKNRVLLSCFQNRRWDGDYLTVRHLIDNGELGEIRWIEMAWQGWGPWGGWRGKREMGGGKLYDLGAHLVDQACLIFPDPIISVYCRMHYDYPQSEVESEAFVVITFAGGQTAVIDLSSMAAIPKPRFYVRGRKGTFIKYGLDPQENALMKGNIDTAQESESFYGKLSQGKEEVIIPTLSGRWRCFYENIANVLLYNEPVSVKLPELRREISVLEAAFISAQRNQVIFFSKEGNPIY